MAISVAVTLRSLLTRALSWAEVDNNFTAIKNALAGAATDADLASPASGKGAALVGVPDEADNYVGTDVDAVLAEIALRAYCVEMERYRALNATVLGEERWDNAFAAAQAAAISKQKPLYLGTGIKYFTNTWNCSANDTSKDGLAIFGASTQFSKMVWRNTTGACMEVAGVDRLHLKDFQISGSCPVGIAGGRGTVRQWNGHHWYENIRVIMNDDMTMNSGIGSIALLGIEPEESCYQACEFWANLPVIICPPNNISVQTFNTDGTIGSKRSMTWTPTYTPIVGTLMSNTVYHFEGGNRLVAWRAESPCMVLRSASAVNLGSTFMQMRDTGTNAAADSRKCPYAIDAENVWGFQWFGTFERGTVTDTKTDVGLAVLSGSLEDWDVVANAGTASSATANRVPVIAWVDFTTAVSRNVNIKARLNGIANQLPFSYSTATSSMRFENCEFDIGTTASLTTVPAALTFNMARSRIVLSGANAVTPVYLEKPNRYTSVLHASKQLNFGVATKVATIELGPSGVSSGCASFQGVTLCGGYLYTDSYIASISGEFDVSWSRTSATTGLTASVTRSSWGTAIASSAGNLTIAAPTISFVYTGQTQIDIYVLSNLSGSSASSQVTEFDALLRVTANLGFNTTTARASTQ